jgi:hypothetical protein
MTANRGDCVSPIGNPLTYPTDPHIYFTKGLDTWTCSQIMHASRFASRNSLSEYASDVTRGQPGICSKLGNSATYMQSRPKTQQQKNVALRLLPWMTKHRERGR